MIRRTAAYAILMLSGLLFLAHTLIPHPHHHHIGSCSEGEDCRHDAIHVDHSTDGMKDPDDSHNCDPNTCFYCDLVPVQLNLVSRVWLSKESDEFNYRTSSTAAHPPLVESGPGLALPCCLSSSLVFYPLRLVPASAGNRAPPEA